MRGQKMNDAQRVTFQRLIAKGWRGNEDDMFALAVPMYYYRPHPLYPHMSRPHVIHIRRDGKCYRGYPGHSSVKERNKNYQRTK